MLRLRYADIGILGNALGVVSAGNSRDLIRFAREQMLITPPNDASAISAFLRREEELLIQDVISDVRLSASLPDQLKFQVASQLIAVLQADREDQTELLRGLLSHLMENDVSTGELREVKDTLSRLAVQVAVLGYLADHTEVFQDDRLSTEYQSVFALVANSPMEAEHLFLGLRST